MIIFCPIIKDECKSSECISWKDDKCLIFSFLESSTRHSTISVDDVMEDDDDFEFENNSSQKVPIEIETATAEELANELVAFAKEEFKGEKSIWISQSARFFWEKKGLNRYGEISGEINLKLEKAERLAQQQINDEKDAGLQKRLEAETSVIPQLVARCTSWAIKHGISRLTQSDVDAYLLEEKIVILPATKRAVYATSNVNLKSNKR